jgi:cyanuric acid amidohydrolase
MRGREVSVFCIPMRGPGDTQGLTRLIEGGRLNPFDIVAVLGKTEGNGGVNDFTREYATWSFCAVLAPYLGLSPKEVDERIAFVMSGGTEGVLSPHITLFARKDAAVSHGGRKHLSIGIAMTRPFRPEELGRAAQVEETARAVRSAIEDAAIAAEEDVHFVQVKCPLLTAERIEDALSRGESTVTKSGYGSMAYSRGASALGVAVALGEIAGPVPDDAIAKDWSLYSSVASASAGIELMRSVVIVFGNSPATSSPYRIGHAVMKDAIDLASVSAALLNTGLDLQMMSGEADRRRIVNIFAKAEASPDGMVRGFRHTMLDDTDISATRHARAAVGGLIAGVAGHGAIYVSGGAEHQGPPGGGPIAVIAAEEP